MFGLSTRRPVLFAGLLCRLLPTAAYMGPSRSNDGLIDHLIRAGIVSDQRVEIAMRALDRADYCRPDAGLQAYADNPLPIGHAATISAPHMHAHALIQLKERLIDGANALDVGVGSGYLSAAMAHMVGERGTVHGIDYLPELVDMARTNIAKHSAGLLSPSPSGGRARVSLAVTDGWKGVPGHSFDAIHVGAAAATVPQALVEQLKPGGRMIIPVGTDEQALMAIDKDEDGAVHQRRLMLVRYVPLVKR